MTDLFGDNEMRALWWKEPFASLMLYGKIETRTWSTDYRGLVLICASKKAYSPTEVLRIARDHQYNRIRSLLLPEGEHLMNVNMGHAIAVGELVDCRMMREEDQDKCFVEWNSDLYCHVYKDVRAIDPFMFPGQQGWKKLEQEFINSIKYKS